MLCAGTFNCLREYTRMRKDWPVKPPQVTCRNLIQRLSTAEAVRRGLSGEDETRKLPKTEEIVNVAAIL
jgi:hypothetical protein